MDFYDDVNQQQLYALDHLYGIPTFVKNAEIDSVEDVQQLNSNTFADVRERKFPCHTKAATWLANAYFQLAREAYSKKEAEFVQDRIDKFAAFWGISGLVNRFTQVHVKTANFQVDSLPDDKFALVAVSADGQKVRRLPMPNAFAVKMAGEQLYANRFKYPYAWRKSAARRILKEAIYYNELHKRGSHVPGAAMGITNFDSQTLQYLERASGFGITHPIRAAEKVASRVMALKANECFKDRAAKLAEIAQELASLEKATPTHFQKLAEVIDHVDRETGLFNYYHSGLDMPEEMFFDVLEKEAEEVLDSYVRLTTGKAYPIGLIANLPLHKVAAVLGDDFQAAVCAEDGNSIDIAKFAEIAPTLPRDDAALLEKAIDQALQEPIDKIARAGLMANESFSKTDLTNKLRAEGKHVLDEDADYRLVIKANG